MSFKLIISQEAQQDIEESIQFYNLQKENLGFEFYDCILEKFYKIKFRTFSLCSSFQKCKGFTCKPIPIPNLFQG